MFSEQFVQDVFSRPERIQRVLAMMRREGWQFVPLPDEGEIADCDVVNQEISVDKGRIDILATFNRRSRLVVVEVKAGIAGLEALSQLNWYLQNLPLDSLGLQKVEREHVVGILLAEGFVGIPDTPANVALLEFKFAGTSWPLRVVEPRDTLGQGIAEDPAPRAAKASRLITYRDHRDWMLDLRVREAFDRIAHCFLDRSEDRSEWLLANVKGDHVAVHYKGEYLVHLWARRNYFHAGYQVIGKSSWIKVEASNSAEVLQTIERDCRQMLAIVDDRLATAIPPAFAWRSAT
jgi:acetolactate synthase regulatory subunit